MEGQGPFLLVFTERAAQTETVSKADGTFGFKQITRHYKGHRKENSETI